MITKQLDDISKYGQYFQIVQLCRTNMTLTKLAIIMSAFSFEE